MPRIGSRNCPHGVQVGPLDDYGVPPEQEVAPFSAYCWICAGLEGPTPEYPEPTSDDEGAK